MGYTHYWKQYRNFDDREWSEITKFVGRLCRSKEGKTILGTTGQEDKLLIDDSEIIFNGKRKFNKDCETFLLSKIKPLPREEYEKKNGYSFQFCKTNEMPYDKFVTAALIIANNIAPKALVITSDGFREDWRDGLDLAHQYMIGLSLPNSLKTKSDYKIA